MWMSRLNRGASELALEFELAAGTDVTGFGLLGHGLEMAEASGVHVRLEFAKIPFLAGAMRYAGMGAFAGGLDDNRTFFGPRAKIATAVERPGQQLLFDPQTSGGLLLGVPSGKVDAILKRGGELGQSLWVIGRAEAGAGISVE